MCPVRARPPFSRRCVGAIDGAGDFPLLICAENQLLGCPITVLFWHQTPVRSNLRVHAAWRICVPDWLRVGSAEMCQMDSKKALNLERCLATCCPRPRLAAGESPWVRAFSNSPKIFGAGADASVRMSKKPTAPQTGTAAHGAEACRPVHRARYSCRCARGRPPRSKRNKCGKWLKELSKK